MIVAILAIAASSLLDGFDRANGSLGTSWSGDTAQVRIVAGAAKPLAGDWSVVNGAAFGPHQRASVRWGGVGGAEHDILLKVQGTSFPTPHVEIRYDDGLKNVRVTTWDAAAGWHGYATWGATIVAGDTLTADADSTGTVRVWRNAQELGSCSVGAWPAAQRGGRVGLTMSGTGVACDALWAETIDPVPPPPPASPTVWRMLSFTTPTTDDDGVTPIGDQLSIIRVYAAHDSAASFPLGWALAAQWGARHFPAGTRYTLVAWPDSLHPVYYRVAPVDTAGNEAKPSNIVRAH